MIVIPSKKGRMLFLSYVYIFLTSVSNLPSCAVKEMFSKPISSIFVSSVGFLTSQLAIRLLKLQLSFSDGCFTS